MKLSLTSISNLRMPSLEELRKHKRTLIPAAVLAVFFAIALVLFQGQGAALKRLSAQKEQMAGFNTLLSEYQSLKKDTSELERLAALSPREGIMTTLENLLAGVGLKGKITSLKSVGTKEVDDSVQEQAELMLKKLTLNEAVNALYKIENAPMLLSIKSLEMKSSFSGETLDLRIVASLTRKK